VASRGVRWFKYRSPEYQGLAQNLKEIILLEIARNKSICKQLRERYCSVIWGRKGRKAELGLAESEEEKAEWDSERSEESDELEEESNESEDTEDESEEGYGGGSRSHKSGASMRKKFPFIRLVVTPGKQEEE